MTESERIQYIVSILKDLKDGQIGLVEDVVSLLGRRYINIWRLPSSDFIDDCVFYILGDLIRVHHAFSKGPFTKDKFEFALEKASNLCGKQAELASSGNPGFDITISGTKISLKTEAEKTIHADYIHVSKFMELGKGDWSDRIEDFIGLRDQFLTHLSSYERIFTLRCLSKRTDKLYYELVEIPKGLLEEAVDGEFRKARTKVTPISGYCDVFGKQGEIKFRLYFDGGGERKLQIKDLQKTYCTVHAFWEFSVSV
jgi:hypothetical protein